MSGRAAPSGVPAAGSSGPAGYSSALRTPVVRSGALLAVALVSSVSGLGCDDDVFRTVDESYQVVGGEPSVDPSLPSIDRTDTAAQPGDFASSSPVQVDAFVQKQVAKVDILWVIDNSGSMESKQNKVKTNFQSFIAKLVENNSALDYHIGVITTDTSNPAESGKLINKANLPKPWIGKDTCGAGCDPVAKFRDNSNVGIGGSGDEKGMLALMLALSPGMQGQGLPNAGFLRDDAALFIIILSDEEDSSCSPIVTARTGGGCTNPISWGAPDYFYRFFEGIKGYGRKEFVTLGAIVALEQTALPSAQYGPGAVGCRSVDNANDVAFYAPRYIDVAKRTGGLATSICDSNYLPALQNLGFLATGAKTTFLLSRAPDAAQLRVYVTPPGGGTRVLQQPGRDYNYRPCTGATNTTVFNAIEFTLSALPPASATIEVEYPVNVRGVTCP